MRRDLLPECNGSNAPLDIFSEQCCKFCINAECTRSQFGKTKFDQRVSTWEERLFTKVPRMDQHDPRFSLISGQKFLSLDVGRVPEVGGSWVDPRDLEARQGPLGAAPPSPVASVNVEAAVVEAQAAPAPVDQPVNPPVVAPKLVSRRMVLGNTPAQSGTILPGGTSPSAPAKDPWAAPVPASAPETPATVVKPGATVKLRGSGV